MNKTQSVANLVMFISAILFALNIPASKALMLGGHVSGLSLTLIRFIVPTIIFWILSLFTPYEKVNKKDLFTLFWAGIFGLTLNLMPFVLGLERTSPVDASIIITLSPLFVMLIAAMVFKEPITLQKAGGVLLGMAGAIIVVVSTHSVGNGHFSWEGNGLIFLCCVGYAAYLIVMKPLSGKYSTITLMKWVFLFGTIVTLPFSYQHLTVPPETTVFEWGLIAYVTIGATVLAYLLVPIALKTLRPTVVGMYNYTQPIIASMVAIMIGQDVFHWAKPIALICVCTGVYLVISSKSRAEIDALKK